MPFLTLKSPSPMGDVSADDLFLSDSEATATRSDPRNLVDANPDAFAGSCNRYVFDEGMILLVFLRRREGRLVVYAPPFARALEDVASAEALWVKAVRLYVEIAAVPKTRRRAAMEARRGSLARKNGDADARLLARDLDKTLHQLR